MTQNLLPKTADVWSIVVAGRIVASFSTLDEARRFARETGGAYQIAFDPGDDGKDDPCVNSR